MTGLIGEVFPTIRPNIGTNSHQDGALLLAGFDRAYVLESSHLSSSVSDWFIGGPKRYGNAV